MRVFDLWCVRKGVVPGMIFIHAWLEGAATLVRVVVLHLFSVGAAWPPWVV